MATRERGSQLLLWHTYTQLFKGVIHTIISWRTRRLSRTSVRLMCRRHLVFYLRPVIILLLGGRAIGHDCGLALLPSEAHHVRSCESKALESMSKLHKAFPSSCRTVAHAIIAAEPNGLCIRVDLQQVQAEHSALNRQPITGMPCFA